MTRNTLAFVVTMGLIAGCASEAPKSDPIIPIDQVPKNLLEISSKHLLGYTFDTVYKVKIDGKDAYLIRGKNKQGKVREVEISATGEVLEIE